jgi:hypothetical protein
MDHSSKTNLNDQAIFTDTINETKLDIQIISKKVVNILKKKGANITENQAGVAICLLLQKGACLKTIDQNFKVLVNPGDTSDKNIFFSVAQLYDAFKKCGVAGKLRPFARKYATLIAQIAEQHNVPGILYNQYKNEHSIDNGKYLKFKFPEESSHWMSDFQSNNADCPDTVKELDSAYRERRAKRLKNAQKSPKIKPVKIKNKKTGK